MSTRGAFGFHIDGKDKIMYSHYDSYPAGLGEIVASSVEFVFDKLALDIEKVRANVRRIKMLDSEKNDKPPTAAERRHYAAAGLLGKDICYTTYELFTHVLGEGLLHLFMTGKLRRMPDSHEFMGDSLFCEWAYIINLDSCRLEFYKGFVKSPQCHYARGRYVALDKPVNGYYGVGLLDEFALCGLNSEGDGMARFRSVGAEIG